MKQNKYASWRAGSAPGTQKECLRRQYANAVGGSGHAVSPALVPPPAPPLPRRPLSKGNPPGGETHPVCTRSQASSLAAAKAGGTQHGSLLFECRRPAVRARSAHAASGSAERARTLGARNHSAASPIPPTPQGIRAHKPHYVLPLVCPASCFGGRGRAVGRLAAPRTTAASPRCPRGARTSSLKPCPPPPSRPRRIPRAPSSPARRDRKAHAVCGPRGSGQMPPPSAARHDRRALSPIADKRSGRLPLSACRRFRTDARPPPSEKKRPRIRRGWLCKRPGCSGGGRGRSSPPRYALRASTSPTRPAFRLVGPVRLRRTSADCAGRPPLPKEGKAIM